MMFGDHSQLLCIFERAVGATSRRVRVQFLVAIVRVRRGERWLLGI